MRTVSPFFFFPYESRTATEPPKDVLIIGGGTGSDTAAALASGAEHVDVVEIDPRLVELGRAMNPDGAFLDPRVDVHVTDGREFLESNDTQYDMVVFALPNSIALVAGQSGLRLESFLFTKEAIEQAKAHLAPDGVFTLVNFFREPFVVDRLAGTITEVFGTEPCLSILGDQGHLASLIVSTDPTAVSCPTATWVPPDRVPEAATDDHPFPYVADRIDPGLLPAGDRAHPARVARRGAAGQRVGRADAPLRRPVLHGRGVPAARDAQHRHVLAAVRDDVARERIGVRRDPGRSARGDRGGRPIPAAPPRDLVRGAGGIVGGGMARAGQLDAVLAVGGAAGGRHRRGVPARLLRQRHLRAAIPGRVLVDDSVRRQPPRGRCSAGCSST